MEAAKIEKVTYADGRVRYRVTPVYWAGHTEHVWLWSARRQAQYWKDLHQRMTKVKVEAVRA